MTIFVRLSGVFIYSSKVKKSVEIKASRIQINPLLRSDFLDVLKMYSEPNSFLYVRPFQNKSSEFFIDFLNKKLKANNKEVEFWTIRKKRSNRFLGTINLNELSSNSLFHIGCHIKETEWNKGYAFEALSELLIYGIKAKGLKEIYGIFENENKAMKKVLEKLKFDFYKEDIYFNHKVNIYKYLA